MPDNGKALAAPQGDSSGATNAQASESTSGTNDSPGGTGGAIKAKRRAQNQEWYAKNREKTLARSKAWYRSNKQKAKNLGKQWHAKNPDYYKEWHAQHPGYRGLWRRLNPDKAKLHDRKKNLHDNYGISLGIWHAMLINQSGRCGLCNTPFGNIKAMEPVVDHNHNTKVVRELLHLKCNITLAHHEKHGACDLAHLYLNRHNGGSI